LNIADQPLPCVILVVDDQADTREMIRVWLTLQGFKVEVAVSGDDALAILSSQRIDSVLTDLWMPEMSGADLIARIRLSPQHAGLPIIMMSAGESAHSPMAKDADAFLAKPFKFDTLLEFLTRFKCYPNKK
jgi:CheY-like chemotaxis protein